MIDTHEAVVCNLCGARDGDVVADEVRPIRTPAGDFAFHVRLACCARCGLVYWTPRMKADVLAKYYEAVFRAPVPAAGVTDERRQQIRGRLDWLRRFVPRGALLEIGAGEGFFLQRAIEDGFDATGLEPSRVYAQLARRIAPAATIVEGFIDRYDAPASADVVCAFFVLEHSLDGLDFLQRCHRVLKPGGWCFLEVPDVSRYASQTGDMLWHEHTYHFMPQTLTRLLARAGFRVERLESPGPSYPFGMAVLAQRLPSGVADWDRDLPDRPSQQAAVMAFRAHAALIGAYHAALRSFVAPLLERVRANGARLAVYGTGVFFDQMFLHTSLRPTDIALVVDDNDEKWGTRTRQGLAIESPQRIKDSGIDIVLTGTDTFEAPVAAKAEALAADSRVAFALVRPHSGALAGLAAMKVQ